MKDILENNWLPRTLAGAALIGGLIALPPAADLVREAHEICAGLRMEVCQPADIKLPDGPERDHVPVRSNIGATTLSSSNVTSR